MRIKDALSTFQTGKKKTRLTHSLSTVWSENAEDLSGINYYPRPQFRRDNWFSLNGWWNYAINRQKGRPDSFDGQILVPFSPETKRSGVNRKLQPGEYLWYFRTVSLNDIPKGKRLILHFGAVDQRCTVWWNGKKLGRHANGYLPFSFDVTNYLKEGDNSIWVRVRDDSDASSHCRGKQKLQNGGMFYTAQSGIWQTVWLEWTPENKIENLKITPLYDEGTVRIEVELTTPAPMEIQMLWERDSYCHYVDENDFLLETGNFSRDFPLPDFHPWTPEDPFLYDIRIVAGEDTVDSYFAMRKFSVDMDSSGYPRLCLNNEVYFQNGVLDQGYWPESLYTPPSDDAMIFDISKMKKLGFNMIRKHLKIEPLRWYYHCDRLGMIVWQDMVNGGGHINMPFLCYLPTLFPSVTRRVKNSAYWLFSRRDKRGREEWLHAAEQTVKLLYNCPCIGLWVLFNEGWGQFDALKAEKLVRHWDETRLIDHASGWFDQKGGDVCSIHNYFRRLKVVRDSRPVVLSEYGGAVYHVEAHSYSDQTYGYHQCRSEKEYKKIFWEFQHTIEKLRDRGLAAAVYTQLSDVEEEANGIFTWDRKVCKVE